MDIEKIVQELNTVSLRAKSVRTDTMAQVLPPQDQLRVLQEAVDELLNLWDFYHTVEASKKFNYSR